jgi:gliding motility associated protien GldN
MKTSIMKGLWMAVLLVSFLWSDAVAQRRTPTRQPRARSGYTSGYTNTADTTKKDSANRQQPPSGYTSGYTNPAGNTAQPASNVPTEVIANSGGGLNDTIKQSLRNDNAIERNLVKERTPLAYENIREDDAVYRQKVWRVIDARQKLNLPFRYAATEDNGNQRFISILFNAISGTDSVTAFSADDDRFTTPLTKQEVQNILAGGVGFDTSDVTDLNGNVVKREVRAKQVSLDSIYKFKIKEEWIFDKESSRMFVRILGIAPMMRARTASGIDLGDDRVLFWVYYPDLRPTLAKYEVYNGKNFGSRMSWEELFESRMFDSYLVKSTIDNPFDKEFKDYIKDPLFRLLEGENVKEKIFNYEQSLWSY